MIHCNLLPLLFIGAIVLLMPPPLLAETGRDLLRLEPKVCDMNGTCTSRAFTITPTGKENELTEVVFDVAIKIDSLREDYESSGLKEVFEKALCDYQDWGIDMFCGKDENINYENCTITDVATSDDTTGRGGTNDGTSPFVYDQNIYTIEYTTRGVCGRFCPLNALPGQNSLDSRTFRRRLNPRCERFLIHFLNEANLTDSVNLEVLKDELVADKCDSIYACDSPECVCPASEKENDDTSSSAANSLCYQLILALLYIILLWLFDIY